MSAPPAITDPPLDTPTDRYLYALETHRLAEDLENYILPPWRWREWRRRHREIKRRMRRLASAR